MKPGLPLSVSGVCPVSWCGRAQGWRTLARSPASGAPKLSWGPAAPLLLSPVLPPMHGCPPRGAHTTLSCSRGDPSVPRAQCTTQPHGTGPSVCGQPPAAVLLGGQSCISIPLTAQSPGPPLLAAFICCVDALFGLFGSESLNAGWTFAA